MLTPGRKKSVSKDFSYFLLTDSKSIELKGFCQELVVTNFYLFTQFQLDILGANLLHYRTSLL